MTELASLLIENGYEDVKTYIQSGNVVLRGKSEPGESVKSEVEKKFGFKPEIMVINKLELEEAVRNNPYDKVEGKTTHFYFTSKALKPNIEMMNSLASNSEKFSLKGNVFYLHAPDGIGRSKLVANIEKCLGVPATGRNLNTVKKILEMVKDA